MANSKRTRPMSFSSEHVVKRFYGGEKLDHSKGAVRMDFIKSGRAPLLRDHDMRRQIGVIDDAAFGGDKVGRATARFGRSSTAEDALQDVDDSIAVNTSVGYRIHKMVLDSVTGDEEVYRMTDWEPYEVSLVSVPADPSVGMGRNLEEVIPDPDADPDEPAAPINDPPPEARTTRASSVSEPATSKGNHAMTTATTTAAKTGTDSAAAAAADAATRAAAGSNPRFEGGNQGPSAEQMETARVAAISNMCKPPTWTMA